MSRSRNLVLLAAVLLFLAGGQTLWAQCTVTRSQIQSEIAAGATAEDLQARYGNCTAASETPTSSAALLPGISLAMDDANTFVNFNTTWERIESCGYHPQREELDCAIEIRQNTGYGGPICVGRGSHEWVLFCVNFGAGLVPVGIGQVHVHDAPAGSVPPWDFGVVVQANPRLAGLANNGVTLQGKAILSWAIVPPQNCFWAPPWGQWANFRIRLDP